MKKNPESLAFAFFQFILVAAGLQFELLTADYGYPRRSKLWPATDSGWGERWMARHRGAGRQSVSQSGRQTEAARKHGKGRLTNCFCSLRKGAARHGLVWALTFRRVKSDPRRKGGRREGRWREGERNGKRKKINGRVRETSNEEDRRERRRKCREKRRGETKKIDLVELRERKKKKKRRRTDWRLTGKEKHKMSINQTNR